MAEILGNQLCMESLCSDIQDVQWIVNDISSRTGPLNLPSWKFPDKQSWELNIEQLLEMFGFSQDEPEENQVAHIALYELLIDRLMLLVQGTALYLNQLHLMGTGRNNDLTSPPSTSVGLAVKHFWSQLTNLQSLMQQLNSQNKTYVKKIADFEKSLKRQSSENSLNSASAVMSANIITDCPLSTGVYVHSPSKEISCDESNKSSQTVETAFVPCEMCDVVQKKMRESGDLVIEACQGQGLPSCLRKYRPQVAHVHWLSVHDVSRWMSEQNKDIQRLCKHLEQMTATIGPLKAQLSAFEKETKEAEARAKQCEKELKEEKETQIALKKQFQVKLQEKEKQHDVTLADLHRQKEELLHKHMSLARELKQHKDEATELQVKLQEWESKSHQLQKEVDNRSELLTRLQDVDKEVTTLREQLSVTRAEVETSGKALAKEQGKNKSATQHIQQVQARHESLSQRVKELGQENEDLREQVSELEEDRQGLQDSLTHNQQLTEQLKNEKQEHEMIIRNLKEEKTALEQSIQDMEAQIKVMEEHLAEAKERERLIVEYPDINGPVNPDLQGTGDIAMDMENQVKANTMRIQLLTEQNEGLRRSIAKVLSVRQPAGQQPKITGPMPLWRTASLDTVSNQLNAPSHQHHASDTTAQNTFFNSNMARGAVQKSNSDTTPNCVTVNKGLNDNYRQQRRPQSGRHSRPDFMPVNATSIGAYKQIKKNLGQTRLELGSASKGGHTRGDLITQPKRGCPEETVTQMYICSQCDKMYCKARDLEIHKSYCTA